MKSHKHIIILFSLVLFFFSCEDGSTTNDTEENPDTGDNTISSVEIASWNIRILSDGSRDDTELAQIATILERYDFVAIQEVRDTVVLDRLESLLPDWDYIVSEEVGNTVKELYAFFFDTTKISSQGTAYIYSDPNNSFIREPYVAHFSAGEIDFTVITIHTIYGDSVTDRRAENALLDDVIEDVDAANGSEKDILLMGDFNLPADDIAWDMSPYTNLVPPTEMTTITDTSSYDNIWLNTTYTTECDGSLNIYAFDNDFSDDAAASLAVSDHRPISTVLSCSSDDDSEGDWTTTTGEELVIDPLNPPTTGDIRITNVVTAPTDSESVTIQNFSSWSVDLSNWTIGDLNDPDSYGIPNGTIIDAGEAITYSTELNFGINNTGETIYLKNNGVTIDTWGE